MTYLIAFALFTILEEFYACDQTFRLLVECWVKDRCCPLPLGDYLRENGFWLAGEACDRCVSQPVQEVYYPSRNEDPTPCGVFPTSTLGMNGSAIWWWSGGGGVDIDFHHPHHVRPWPINMIRNDFPTPQEAIVFMLGAYSPAGNDTQTPKDFT